MRPALQHNVRLAPPLAHHTHTQKTQSVRDNPELRKAVAEVQSEVVAFELRLGQSRALYDALTAINQGAGWAKLSATQQRVVLLQLRDLELGGVALSPKHRARYNEIQQELAQVGWQSLQRLCYAGRLVPTTLSD